MPRAATAVGDAAPNASVRNALRRSPSRTARPSRLVVAVVVIVVMVKGKLSRGILYHPPLMVVTAPAPTMTGEHPRCPVKMVAIEVAMEGWTKAFPLPCQASQNLHNIEPFLNLSRFVFQAPIL
jgi:hypothetical protein